MLTSMSYTTSFTFEAGSEYPSGAFKISPDYIETNIYK